MLRSNISLGAPPIERLAEPTSTNARDLHPVAAGRIGTIIVLGGRFQPVHFGHLETIVGLLEQDGAMVDSRDRADLLGIPAPVEVVVAIADKPVDSNNWLDVGTRRLLVDRTLREYGIAHVWTEALPDLRDAAAEATYVRRMLSVPAETTFRFATGNPAVGSRLEAAGLHPLRLRSRRSGISATLVRRLLAENRIDELRALVPPTVIQSLVDDGHVQRLREILADSF